MTKLTVEFRNSVQAPKKIQSPNVLVIYTNDAHDGKVHYTPHYSQLTGVAGYKQFGTSSTSQCDFCQALAQTFRPVETEGIMVTQKLITTTRASKIAC